MCSQRLDLYPGVVYLFVDHYPLEVLNLKTITVVQLYGNVVRINIRLEVLLIPVSDLLDAGEVE